MTTSNTKGRVLVVDDEAFFRELLRGILAKAGFTVVAEAADGQDAVEKFRSLRPDVILMDIFMAEKNGIDATRDILALDPRANVVICSGTGYEDDVAFALQLGAKGVVYKPFLPNEVIAEVVRVLPGR